MILFKKTLKWLGIIIFGAFVVLVIIRAFHFYNLDKTNAQVAKIHATKLKFEDVMPNNLPPDPGAGADKTVAGVDANNNGIRDDVELAIFKAYPNSAKTRAALLQYALSLQMSTNQPIINKDTATEVVRERSRANSCVADALVPRKSPESSRSNEDMDKINFFIDFVDKLQINTQDREKQNYDFYEKIGSYSESGNEVCDIDYSTLPN